MRRFNDGYSARRYLLLRPLQSRMSLWIGELGANRDEQMHMVGHRFQLDDFRPMFGADLADDLVQTLVHWTWVALDGWIGDLGVVASDDGTPVLRTPDDVVGAPVGDVVVGTDSDHICIISTELCIV